MPEPGTHITQLLHAWRNGDEGAKKDLFAEVYDVLRRLARKQRASLGGNDTLNTTALVNELYLKLNARDEIAPKDREHFLSLCAQAMRHLLVDYARRVGRRKRGGPRRPISLDDIDGAAIAVEHQAEELLDLDSALTKLERKNERLSRTIELRYFAGLSCEEIAELRGVTRQTVSRDWLKARVLLKEFLQEHAP